MRKRITESDINRLVKRVLKESEMDELEMMDVSSDSDYYKSRKRHQSIPGDELSVLMTLARKFCENNGYKMGGRLEDIGLSDCQTVEEINRNYSFL